MPERRSKRMLLKQYAATTTRAAGCSTSSPRASICVTPVACLRVESKLIRVVLQRPHFEGLLAIQCRQYRREGSCLGALRANVAAAEAADATS